MKWTGIGLALILQAQLGACAVAMSGAADAGFQPRRELPALDSLDALRGPQHGQSGLRRSSALQSLDLEPSLPLLGQNTAPLGDDLIFTPDAEAIAYAIYRFDPPGALISLEAAGSAGPAGLWLLIADFSSGTWGSLSDLSSGTATLPFSAVGDPVSPAGHVYVAAVCAPISGSPQTVLTSLLLNCDAAPPGPVYYVAMPADGGNDGNDGSFDHPWATLQHAADLVVANDTVIVRPGQYAGFMLERSGSPGQPIRFNAEPGAEISSDNPTTSDGINLENWGGGGPDSVHDIVIHGFTVSSATRAGIRVVGTEEDPAHDIVISDNISRDNGKWGILSGFVDKLTVEGNTCSGSLDEHGIYLSNSGDGNIVRRNHCYGNNASGIQFNADASLGGDGTMSNALIEYNICHDNGVAGGAALNLDGVADSLIRGNLLYDNHATGLVIYNGDGQGSRDNRVFCNTILQPADGRWCITIGTSPGNQLFGNILLSDHSFRGAIDIDSASLPGFGSDYNILAPRFSIDDSGSLDLGDWQSASGQDAHSAVQSAAELFVNPGGKDFHLRAGSPGIDFLSSLAPGLPPEDIEARPRPQGSAYDAGAYEYAE